MDVFLFLTGFIGFIVFMVFLIINIIKKKPKKNILIGLAVCFVTAMIGISITTTNLETQSEQEQQAETVDVEEEPTQEELNNKLKEEAVQANFVDINGDKVAKGAKLYLEGKIETIFGTDRLDKFSMSTKENGGYGMYDIVNLVGNGINIKKGDNIKVWGVYNGKDEKTSMPIIDMTVYEKTGENTQEENDQNESMSESEWKQIVKFEGKSIKDTQTFNISSDEWRIVWDTKPGDIGETNFQIYVYDGNGNPVGSHVVANIIGKGNDVSYMRGSGEYYLTINTAQPYTIIVEEKN